MQKNICCEMVANGYIDCCKCYEWENNKKKLEALNIDLSKKLSKKELNDIRKKLNII